MEAYYSTHPDGPIQPNRLEFIQRHPIKNDVPAYSMFEMQGAGANHPILIFVDEHPKSDSKVDWQSFVEFKEDRLKVFLESPGAAPVHVRVIMHRKHAYDKDVPEINTKDSFEIVQPGAPYSGSVFVPQGSPCAKLLGGKLSWNTELAVIIELSWRKQGSFHWIEVTSIVSWGWKG